MASPYEIVLGRQRAVGAPTGLANPAVRGVLEQTETPGTFEQFFRFLGRPGFAVRSGLSGDFAAAGKNVGQFLNEIFLGGLGAVNPNWTLTGALNMLPGIEGLPTDLTSRKDRPEFTDLMKAWGIADPRYMGFGEKLAYDIVGGIFTDPLSLVGGAPKGVTAKALQTAVGPGGGARRIAMQRAASVGMRQGGGKQVNALLDRFEDEEILTTAGRLAEPRTRPKFGPTIRQEHALGVARQDVAGMERVYDASVANLQRSQNVQADVEEGLRSAAEFQERHTARTLGERRDRVANYTRYVAEAQDEVTEAERRLVFAREDRRQADANWVNSPQAAPNPDGSLPSYAQDWIDAEVAAQERAVAAAAAEAEAQYGVEAAQQHLARISANLNAERMTGSTLRQQLDESREVVRQGPYGGLGDPVDTRRLTDETIDVMMAQEAVDATGRDFMSAGDHLSEVAGRVLPPGPLNPKKVSVSRALSQFNSKNLTDFVRRAGEFGITQRQASTIVLGIQNRAAEKLFFANSALAGVDMSRAARTLNPDVDDAVAAFVRNDNPTALVEMPVGLSTRIHPTLDAGVRNGTLAAIRIPSRASAVFFRPRQRIMAEALANKYEALTAAQSLGKPAGELATIQRDIGMMLGHSDDAIKANLTSLYGEQVANETVTGLETWKRFLEETPDSVINSGIKGLQDKGMTGDGVSYFNPLKGEFSSIGWDKIFGITLPGLVMKGLRKTYPNRADQITNWASAISDMVINRIFSRYHPTGGVDPTFGAKARGIMYSSFANTAKHADETRRTFMKLAQPEREEMTRQIDMMSERYQAAVVEGEHLTPEVQAEARRRLAALTGEDLTDVVPAPGGPIAADRRPGGAIEVRRLRGRGTPQSTPEMLRQMSEKILSERYMGLLQEEIRALVPNPEAIGVLETWRKGMGKIPPYMRYGAKWEDDLKNFSANARAAWDDALENPFYLPHQMSPRLHQMLDEGMFDNVAAGRINDVFSGTRKYRTRREFVQVLEGLADSVGLELDDGLESVQQLDLAELYYRRMVSFELTQARQSLYQEATRTMKAKGGGRASDYRFYINRVLHPTAALDWATGEVLPGGSARKNFFSKLLGGGRFVIPIQSRASADSWAKKLEGFGARVVGKEGVFGVSFRFPGFNAVYKPLLTSHPLNPKFRIRNILSSALMMQFVPGFGPAGFMETARALWDDGAIRTLRGFYNSPKDLAKRMLVGPTAPLPAIDPRKISEGDYLSAAMRFGIGATQAERDAAFEFLRRSGTTVGPYSWDQAGPAIRLVMGPGGGANPADLSSGTEMIPRLMEEVSSLSLATRADEAKIGRARQALRDYVAHGERLSNEVEARFRYTAMLRLLAQGVDPYQAAKQVSDAFVDYSKQSVVERTLRDIFPFARFMIGSTAWAKGMLEKPGAALPAVMKGLSPLSASMVTPQNLASMQRSLSSQTEGEAGGGAFLPGEAAGTIALPLPWRDKEGNIQFLTSLGIPHEATLQIVGAFASTDALRKNVLGGLQPVVRLPTEALTGRSFYFGTDFGSYRKSPAYLEPFADRIPGKSGRPDRFEVDGMLNEIINASPISNPASLIDKFMDHRRSFINKAFVTTTGVKITSVDLEREVKRRVADYLKDKVDSGQIGEVQAFFTRVDPEEVPEDLKIMLAALAQERAEARRENREAEKKGRGLGY